MRFSLKESYANKRSVTLNIKDKKLIQLLIQDGRASISELSKRVGISKPGIVQKIKALTEREVLLAPVLYADVRVTNKNFYVYSIGTQLGLDTAAMTKKLLKLPGVGVVVWYNGPYNLLIASFAKEPGIILEELERVLPIQRFRLQQVIGNWLHPPHIFKEISDVAIPFRRAAPEVDDLDLKILAALERNPRAPLINIASRTGSSAVTVKRRLQDLKTSGAMYGCMYWVDPWVCGCDMVSIMLSVKGKKNTDMVLAKLLALPQTCNLWEFAHEMNINVVLWVKDQKEVNDILAHLHRSCAGILTTEVSLMAGMSGN